MVIWFTFLIPLLSSVVLLLFWSRKTTWWELSIKLGVALLLVICAKGCSTAFLTDDTEYLSYKAVEVWHEDEWDEWIHKTCTERYACGTDSKGNTRYCTRTYDCSYRDYHPDQYYLKDEKGNTHSIEKEEYFKYKKLWENSHFVDMHRSYYTIDGDAQKSIWNKDRKTIRAIVVTNTYENRIKASKNVFNYEKIDEEEARKRHLISYPNRDDDYQPSVLSYENWPWKKDLNQDADYTNAILGPKKQVRVWYVFFKDKPSMTGRWQEAYWQGGNKNEFVICVSLNKESEVQWCHVFSWTDNKNPVVKVQKMIMDQKKFDPLKTNLEVEKILEKEFERKHFKDFSYLEIEPTATAIIISYVLLILFSVGFSIWIVKNDEDDTDNRKKYNGFYYTKR